MACSKYANLTVKELKDEFKKRNARLSGRKKEFVERYEVFFPSIGN